MMYMMSNTKGLSTDYRVGDIVRCNYDDTNELYKVTDILDKDYVVISGITTDEKDTVENFLLSLVAWFE